MSKDQFAPMDQCAEDGSTSMMDSVEIPSSELNCASSVAGSVQDTSHETRLDAENFCPVKDHMSDITPEHNAFLRCESPVLDNPLYGTGLDPSLLTMNRLADSSDVGSCSKAEFSCILNILEKKSDLTSECKDIGSSRSKTELKKGCPVERPHNEWRESNQVTENQDNVCKASPETKGERESGINYNLVDGIKQGEQSLNLEYQCSNLGTTKGQYGCSEEQMKRLLVQNTDSDVKERSKNCNDTTATEKSSVCALDLTAVTQSTGNNEKNAISTGILGEQGDGQLKRMYNPCEIRNNSLEDDLKNASEDFEPVYDQGRSSTCEEGEHSSFEFLQSCFGLSSLDHTKLDQNAAYISLSGSAESCSQNCMANQAQPPVPVGATLESVPRGQTEEAGHDGLELKDTSSCISVSQEPEQQNDSKTDQNSGAKGTMSAYDTGTKNRVLLLSSEKLMRKLQPVLLVKSNKCNAKHGNMYVCAACKKCTQTLDELIDHHHCKHTKHTFQYCPTCGAYFSNRTLAAQHLCEQTGPKDMQQSDIALSTIKPLKFKAVYPCKYCLKQFVKKSYHQDHEQRHTTVTQYRCNHCGLYFPHAKKLAVHKHKIRCSPLIQEPNEQRNTRSETDLKNPAKPAVTYGVDGRQIEFHDCFVKLVDINKKASLQRVNCPVCGKMFKLRAQLKLHLRSHMGSKPLKCKKCNKAFKYSWNLNKHVELCSGNIIKQHISEDSNPGRIPGRFPCPMCPLIFRYSYNRTRHMRQRCLKEYTHTGKGKVGNRYKCPLCNETFSMACNRNRHIKRTCFQQYKLQKIKKLVKVNVKEEKEEKQVSPMANMPSYKCKVCFASFAFKSGVYRHMKKHSVIQRSAVQVKKNDDHTDVKVSDCIDESPQRHEYSTQKDNTLDLDNTHSFLCRFCDKGFDSSDSLNDHLKIHVGKKPFHCLNCGKNFAKRGHLITHRIVHKRRIQCSVCKKIVPTIADLLKHRQSHIKKGMLQCPDCPMQFKFPVYLLRHVASHAKKEAIPKTSLPVEILSRNSSKSADKKVKEITELFHCGICKKTFNDSQSMSKHCLTHLPKASVSVCPVCMHNFTTRTALIRHIRLHTGEKPFPCKTCGMHFHRKEPLRVHQLKCKGPQEKTLCPPSTTVETHVKCEEKSASKSKKVPKEFNCSYCPHVFTMSCNLKMHEKAHLAGSLIACLKCGKYYKKNKICGHRKFCSKEPTSRETLPTAKAVKVQKSEFKSPSLVGTQRTSRITRIGNDIKDHFKERCPHCSKRFQYRSYLLRHLQSHLGKHNFACKHCGQSYDSQNSCQQHEALCDGMLRQHEDKQLNESKEFGDLPDGAASLKGCKVNMGKGGEQLKCSFCTKTFTKSRNLRRHILTHTDVKPYRCKTCETCFSRHDHLKYHQTRCRGKKQHSEVHIQQIEFDHVSSQVKGEPQSDVFKCIACLKTFSSHSNLTRHISLLHSTFKPFSCKRCGTGFTAKDSLKRHSVRGNCKMSPGKCLKTFQMPIKSDTSMQTCRETSKLMQRIEGHYSNKWKFPCEYCPRRFKNQTQLKLHTRLHTGEKPFGCASCDERFIRRDYLKRHLTKCTGKREGAKVLCDRCGGLFSLEALETHLTSCTISLNSTDCPASISSISSSSKIKMFSCFKCNDHFLLFSQLQQHISIKHRYELQSGILDHKRLSNNLHIKEEPVDENYAENLPSSCQINVNHGHENTAEEREKPFVCEQCNMRFITNAGLGMHMRTHTAMYPLSCKKCNKGFWSKNVQQKHVRRCKGLEVTKDEPNAKDAVPSEMECLSNEKVLVFNKVSNTTGTGVLQTKFSCKDQDQENADKKDAVVHKYQCSECEQSFTDGLMLISHLEAHGREDQERRLGKSHRCHICNKTFDQAGVLQRHIKTQHQENAKNTCPECFRSFRYPSDLDIHRTCHDPNRPFVCDICELRFWTPKSLSSHQRAAHSTNEALGTIESSLKTDKTSPKVFTCHPCNKIYTIKRSYMKHCRVKHKGCSKNLEDLKGATTEHQLSNNESDGSDADDQDVSDDSDSAPYFPCHVCGKTFVTSESLEDHQRCHLGEKPYECEECGKCFVQLVNLQQHQRSHKSEFQCQMCGKGFVSLFALRKHKHTHVRKRPHRCTKCHLSFTKSSQLREHMATHRGENFPCDLCHKSFSCKSSRAEHRKIHKEAEDELPPLIPPANQTLSPAVTISSSSSSDQQCRYRCENCQVRFPDPEQLSEHGCNSAKERPYSCKDCNKHFLHGSHLKKHQLTHQLSGTRSFQCNSCHMSFIHRHHFLAHLQTHGGEESSKSQTDEVKISNTEESNQDKIYRCPICPESFSQVLELANHLSVHANMCNVCNKTFSTKQQLEKHEECHLSAATQYECTECGKSFLGSDAFRQHYCVHQKNLSFPSMQNTDKKKCFRNSSEVFTNNNEEEEEVDVGEDFYNCPTCSKRFPSNISLQEHQKLHEIDRPFKCLVCGKGFAKKRYLTQHQQIHDERPYQCELCSNSFKTQQSFLSHRKTHDAHHKYHCSVCDKSYRTPYDLSRHEQKHPELQTFSVVSGDHRCDMCYKSFSLLSQLRQHQETHVGQVVYECTECDKAFAFLHLLEEHQQTHGTSADSFQAQSPSDISFQSPVVE